MANSTLDTRLVEDAARAIYENRAAFRRRHKLKAFEWHYLSEAAKDEFRSMGQAAVVAIVGHQEAFGIRVAPKPTRWKRLVQWLRDRPLIGEYRGPGET